MPRVCCVDHLSAAVGSHYFAKCLNTTELLVNIHVVFALSSCLWFLSCMTLAQLGALLYRGRGVLQVIWGSPHECCSQGKAGVRSCDFLVPFFLCLSRLSQLDLGWVTHGNNGNKHSP